MSLNNFVEYRAGVLDRLSVDYTAEDLRNFERWRLKVLEGLSAIYEGDTMKEKIIEAVDDWLDDHPEATTTVEDGAIATAKLAAGAATTEKIADGAVTDAKLAANGIKAEVADLKTDLQEAIDEFAVPTQEAVDNWLEAHPEATTTVQDGAITEAKLADTLKLKVLKDYVTPEMFGAVGDGVTNDTAAVNEAIAWGNVMLGDHKTYLVDDVVLQDVVIVANNATFKRDIADTAVYTAVEVSDNVSIYGVLNIDGQRSAQTQTGEWGFGVTISGNNIYIERLDIKDCHGDGIYISNASNLYLQSVRINNAYRNGVSIVSGNGIYFGFLDVKNVTGVSPQAAIDFEPNMSTESITNVYIDAIVCGNVEHGLIIANNNNSVFDNINIKDLVINARTAAVMFSRAASAEKKNTSNNINIDNINIIDCTNNAISIDDWAKDYCPQITINVCTVKRFNKGSAIYTRALLEIGYNLDEVGGFSINNLYYDNVNDAYLFHVYRAQGTTVYLSDVKILYYGKMIFSEDYTAFVLSNVDVETPNSINNNESSLIIGGYNIFTSRTSIYLLRMTMNARCLLNSTSTFTLFNDTGTPLIVNGVETGDGTIDERVTLSGASGKLMTTLHIGGRWYIYY